jgi:hypothetical protein
MQSTTMKAMKYAAIFGLSALVQMQSQGGITLNLGGRDLRTSGGAALFPVNGLVILVASTQNSDFLAPTPDSSFTPMGIFVPGGDDIVIGTVGASALGKAGLALNDIAFFGNWNANDPLKMYWFPSLTTASTSPTAGTSYGAYRSDSAMYIPGSDPQLQYSDSWLTPAESGAAALTLLTQSQGGASPDSAGWANLTVVPEPITSALGIFGGLLVGVQGFRWLRKSVCSKR